MKCFVQASFLAAFSPPVVRRAATAVSCTCHCQHCSLLSTFSHVDVCIVWGYVAVIAFQGEIAAATGDVKVEILMTVWSCYTAGLKCLVRCHCAAFKFSCVEEQALAVNAFKQSVGSNVRATV